MLQGGSISYDLRYDDCHVVSTTWEEGEQL
jgi:hypothetical protein